MNPGISVVNTQDIEWINGRQAWATMEPAFRDNLGDPDRVEDLLSKYWIRPLWVDAATTRRIDHVRTESGYHDLSEAYHHSVEEAYFLGGSVTLTAEGHMQAGDYFWRPPGWVHSASSAEGFDCILMMEGEDATEGSGRVSRVVCRDHEAASNLLAPTSRSEAGATPKFEGYLGPRGYVRRLSTAVGQAGDHDDSVARLDGSGGRALKSQVLSSNAISRSASLLVTIPAGWSSIVPATDRERFLILIEGSMIVDGIELAPCSLVRIEPGHPGPRLSSAAGARLIVKVGGQR